MDDRYKRVWMSKAHDREAHDGRHLEHAMHHLLRGRDDALSGRVSQVEVDGELVNDNERGYRTDGERVDGEEQRT
jgi:hypothetical protein